MTLTITQPHDAVHKAMMLRLLTAVADDELLAQTLTFKGGTCAAMRGFLDRFSVDLDFDMAHDAETIAVVRTRLEAIFIDLGFTIADTSAVVPQYFLKYATKREGRNTLKCEVTTLTTSLGKTELVRLVDIDRVVRCQTIETMFAHKLCALEDRFERHGAIAGRDVYDIHQFFLRGFTYDPSVIEARAGVSAGAFIKDVADFVQTHVTQTIIDQDINTLLTPSEFQKMRKHIVPEVLAFLREKGA